MFAFFGLRKLSPNFDCDKHHRYIHEHLWLLGIGRLSCFGFREPSKDALRLVGEMNLKRAEPQLIRMYIYRCSRQSEALSRRVYAITSNTVCGFWVMTSDDARRYQQ